MKASRLAAAREIVTARRTAGELVRETLFALGAEAGAWSDDWVAPLVQTLKFQMERMDLALAR